MAGKYTKKPTGDSAAAEFAKAQYENLVNESRLSPVSGQGQANTTLGKYVIPSGGRRKSGGVSVTEFKLRFAEDDYLVCREWDAETETLGTTDIYVLKEWHLRCSRTTERTWGFDVVPIFEDRTFTYAADESEPYMEYGETVPESDPPVNEWGETEESFDVGGENFELRMNRVRTVGGEQQRVIPLWLKGDIIYGIEFDGGETDVGFVTASGQPIEYLQISGSRQWARA